MEIPPLRYNDTLGLCKIYTIILSLALFVNRAIASGEGARVYNNANLTIGTGAWIALTFNSEHYDFGDWHSTASNTSRLTVPTGLTGIHTISCHIYWDSTILGERGIGIFYNNSLFLATQTQQSSLNQHQSITTIQYAQAGDYFECLVFQSSPGDLNIIRSANISPEFSIVSQLPPHHESHEDGGMDEINVTNLSGILADGQNAAWIDTMGVVFPDGCGGTSVLRWDAFNEYWTCDFVPPHAGRHQDGGMDEINVTNLSGILADPQNAGWFQALPITVTGVVTDNVLTWDGQMWKPATVSITGTGGISDVIEISGTVTCVITDTYHFTNTLTSSHDMAVIRSFTYGEASIAIGLFLLAAMIGLVAILWFVRR